MEDKVLFIRGKGKYEKIDISKIWYAEVDNQYITVVTEEQKFKTLATLTQLEKYLPKNKFCRIHRAYIIAIDKIVAFDSGNVFMKDKIIPLAYKSREKLISSINILTREMPARSTKCKTVRQIQQSRQKKL